MITPQNATYAYIGAFVDELARVGVEHVVICPGSRSTPLTLTFAAEERIRKWVLVDERSAAFFALGLAKRSGVPVALVCTSGTAAANFYPAVCEAQQSRVPLLVLTADRPPELQGVGAPQTMGQTHLYGEHVKWFTEMPLAEATDMLLRYARFTAGRAVATAQTIPAGVVHLNIPLRDPLTNIPVPNAPLPPLEERGGTGWQGNSDADKPTSYVQSQALVQRYLPQSVVDALQRTERGVIVVGPDIDGFFGTTDIHAQSIVAIAKKLKYPILADPLSQLRSGAHHHDTIIDSYDVFLHDPDLAEQFRPNLVLRFGGVPTSKVLNLFLERYTDCQHIIIDPAREWLDPSLHSATYVACHPVQVRAEVNERLPGGASGERPDAPWLAKWIQAQNITHDCLQHEIPAFDALFEGRVFTELAGIELQGANVVVGNSMPIRDCDSFLHGGHTSMRVYGNRGVNGIDGQISTALGLGASASEPTVLVVGDLTFYHDLNGLLAAKKYGLNLTVVVINNDGGGIFSFLPQAKHHPDHFEDYFGTATGLDFHHAAALYGGTFTRIQNWDEFRAAVARGVKEGGLHIVEVPTNRAENVTMHRQLWTKVAEALR